MSKTPSGTAKATDALSEITSQDVAESTKVDYPNLKKRFDSGDVFILVKNTAPTPLVIDWDLDLLPEDQEEAFNRYLQEKYVQYELKELIKDIRIVSIYHDGDTINFLNNYLSEKRFPLLLPRAQGKETVLRSSFCLNAGDSVILTVKQADSLRRYEKIKRTWSGADGKDKSSSWLGFLTMKPIKEAKDFFLCDMSYVTTADTVNSHKEFKEGEKTYTRRESNIIREEE